MELNPTSTGSAPFLSNAGAAPATGVSPAQAVTVPVNIASTAPFFNGVQETTAHGLGLVSGTEYASSTFSIATVPGPRTVRLQAENTSADGKRHATAVDFSGLVVK